MCIQIAAVGSNALIADEIELIVRRIIGEKSNVRAMISSEVTGDETIDLYVCALTQRSHLSEKIPQDMLCVLDLRPTAQFFIDISHIPTGETVYIFNSNQQYAEMLRVMCHEHKIHQLNFITVAYEDMPENEVIEHLRQARYIIGVGKLVEKEVLLSEKYRTFLRPDVTIIGRTRMATMETACALIEQTQNIQRKILAQKISLLAEELNGLSPQDISYKKKSTHMEHLIEKLDQAQPLTVHLLNSLAGQLSDHLHAGQQDSNETTCSQDNMADILQKFDASLGKMNHTYYRPLHENN